MWERGVVWQSRRKNYGGHAHFYIEPHSYFIADSQLLQCFRLGGGGGGGASLEKEDIEGYLLSMLTSSLGTYWAGGFFVC